MRRSSTRRAASRGRVSNRSTPAASWSRPAGRRASIWRLASGRSCARIMDWDEFSMLISSRTPLRVSFFGGGTDYPEYFERDRGAVVGMAIDKYVYISALRLIDFIEYKYRVSYSRLEMVHDIADIEHPVVRNVLRHYGVEQALDLSIAAALPARSGLGSSSSFTVGMINLMN